ncbi:MAG: Gfo/Idh/MocA family oxidoreductase [Planctomycetota bacterium]
MSHHSSERRDFLKNASVAAAAASSMPYWTTSASAADENPSASDRPRLALIGCGHRSFQFMPQAMKYGDVVAVADVDLRNANKAAAKYGEEQGRDVVVYQDYRKLLERDDIDVVFCGTVDHWHSRVSIDAMRSGRDVYCEKPLTLTIAEGKQVIKVLGETGAVFQVGTQQRSEFKKNFLKAIAVVRAGRIGEVKKLTCGINAAPSSPSLPVAEVPPEFNWDMWLGQCPWEEYRYEAPQLNAEGKPGRGLYDPLTNAHLGFRWFYQFSGGKLTDWGAHHIDIAQWLIGQNGVDQGPTKIVPRDIVHPVDLDDEGNPVQNDRYNTATKFNITAEFPGVEMLITSEGRNGILVEGTEGHIFVNRGTVAGKAVDALKDDPLPEGALEAVYGGPLNSHMGNFFDCIKTRKTPISDVQSHHRAMTTCHLAGIAARLNRAITWDPVAEKVVGDPQAQSMTARTQREGFEIVV